jgi:hypothetical protein
MSQVMHTEKSGIKARINRLSKLTDSVSTLEEDKKNSDTKREKQEQKNQAFQEVQEVISNIESDFSILRRAVDLADALDSSVPHQDIEQTLDTYRPTLREFKSKSFDDFDGVSEISSTRKKFNKFEGALSDHTETVRDNLTAAATDELTEVKTRETILRIPDIGSPSDAEAVSIYKDKINSIKRGQIINAEELREAKQKYSEVDINIETIQSNYELSEEAGDLLLRFLQNETVTLADIDNGVLDELKALEEFSEKLTIQF